jgi:hypothetical protein
MGEIVWGLWQSLMAVVVVVACGWLAYNLLFKGLRK